MTPEQAIRINELLDKKDLEIAEQKKGLQQAVPYLQELRGAGFHLAAIAINAQLIEHALKSALRAFVLRQYVAEILNLPDPYPNAKLEPSESDTLGTLIERFARFETIDTGSDIAPQLKEFNRKFRRMFIHNLFDGKTEDISVVESEVSRYLDSTEFSLLVLAIAKAHLRVKQETEHMYLKATGGT